MYALIKPWLFLMSAEKAHALSLKALGITPRFCFAKPKPNPVNVLGLQFPHPVGLAAGLDKNGEHLDALAKLGFSFIEIGTVTPRAQHGNPKPRLFRLTKANAIINRMGFNNHGVDAMVRNVQKANYKGILGINIGKNKDTVLIKAVDDYLYCLEKVYGYASYVAINVSSPNTPDLRQLQQGDYFSHLVCALSEARRRFQDIHQRFVPMVIKVSPDECDDDLKKMAQVILKHGLDGLIVTNTTASRESVQTLPHGLEVGGLSGAPLRSRSNACLALLKKEVGDSLVLIGSGGVDCPKSFEEKREAGASLVQLYTGLIYQGPSLVSRLTKSLER